MPIQNNGPVPRYLQMKSLLSDAIRNGELRGKLPSEKDLAKNYGVSYMTARRAIGELVDEHILKREMGRGTFVVEAQERSSLRGSILCLMSGVEPNGMRNPFYSHVFNAVEEAGRKLGFVTMIAQKLEESHFVREGSSARLGLVGVITTAIDQVAGLRELAKQVPVVMVNNYSERLPFPSVSIEQRAGMAKAVNHLCELGHSRIGYIGGLPGVLSSDERLAGYRDAMQGAGNPVESTLMRDTDWSYRGGYHAMEALLTSHPDMTAVCCANDLMALGAMAYLQQNGRSVPNDMSVIGFGNTDQAAQVVPALSSVDVDKDALGRQALTMLLDRVNGQRGQWGQGQQQDYSPINTTLCLRETTSPRRDI